MTTAPELCVSALVVEDDKPLTKAHFDAIANGLVLEDGAVYVDSLAYADSKDKSIIGLEIHSGRNRIVRRIFESLGYDVKGLDRVMYAGLTKKNVERSKWRYLSDKEIRVLKYLNASKVKKQQEKKQIEELDDTPKVRKNPSGKPTKKSAEKAEDKKAALKAEDKKPARVKDDKPAKPRKFKTHSEKKAFEQQHAARK